MFYGPAGAGKTTLLLTIASNLCTRHLCVYISTEETTHYERVARFPEKYEKTLFTEAYDMDTFVKVALATYLLKPLYIFADSINALFRLESLKENTLAKQALATSLLLEATRSSGGKLFASAQIRAGESGGVEAPGGKIVDYYFDAIIGVFVEEPNKRYLKPVKSPIHVYFDKLFFKITDSGVEWL